MAFLAIFGVIAIAFKDSSLNIFRGRAFIQAFCVAAIFAFALEATVFNFQYYLKYSAGGEFETIEISAQDTTVMLTTDTTVAAKVQYEGKDSTERVANGVKFENVNRRVNSIYVEPNFGNQEHLLMFFLVTDQEGTRSFTKTFLKGFGRDYYIPIQFCGDVTEITAAVFGENRLGGASKIVINKPIPLYFSGLRLFAAACAFFAVIMLARKKLRAKVSYFLFEYKFDPADKKQNLGYLCLKYDVLYVDLLCLCFVVRNTFRELRFIYYHSI
jgi:hypothetical protein